MRSSSTSFLEQADKGCIIRFDLSCRSSRSGQEEQVKEAGPMDRSRRLNVILALLLLPALGPLSRPVRASDPPPGTSAADIAPEPRAFSRSQFPARALPSPRSMASAALPRPASRAMMASAVRTAVGLGGQDLPPLSPSTCDHSSPRRRATTPA